MLAMNMLCAILCQINYVGDFEFEFNFIVDALTLTIDYLLTTHVL